MTEEELYRELRPRLFSIAYRMIGEVGEAEDLVQEAFVRFRRATAAGTEIETPRAYLVSVITRLAIDHLRSARVRRESYVGTWLPEPLVTDQDPEEAVETADSLSVAFLVLLEALSPVERAVFLLREVVTRLRELNLQLRPTRVNGRPGALVLDTEGGLVNAVSLDVGDGEISRIWSVANPDKLRHLGPRPGDDRRP